MRSPVPWWAIVIPLLWSLIGGSAAVLLQVPQDAMLPVSGLLALILLVHAQRIAPA